MEINWGDYGAQNVKLRLLCGLCLLAAFYKCEMDVITLQDLHGHNFYSLNFLQLANETELDTAPLLSPPLSTQQTFARL